ncbi:MAG: NAD(P)-dependent dehydrogenase (short-subunit alcohol dehydrogenase family) [Limisphaerales bacterium]|jgi:NAD(P)-dependent dehydrogenase (short-subunit alcohol dehydrogenase family)
MKIEDFSGKVAFVTGAASGIGLAIARDLLDAGASVMLCDISRDSLDAALATLATDFNFDSVVADVSVKEELQSAAAATVARFGRVDIHGNRSGVDG